jgi:hypothetical protein
MVAAMTQLHACDSHTHGAEATESRYGVILQRSSVLDPFEENQVRVYAALLASMVVFSLSRHTGSCTVSLPDSTFVFIRTFHLMSRGNAVSIATGYWLDVVLR